MEHSLLCDEQWLASSPMSLCQTPVHRPCPATHAAAGGGLSSFYSTKEDRDHAFAVCLQKEGSYSLAHGYAQRLCSSGLIHARFKAVRLIIQTQCRLNLSIGSVFDAVNYFDRYVSTHYCVNRECWKFELLSIACLSIASKCHEVSTPSLIEFQEHRMHGPDDDHIHPLRALMQACGSFFHGKDLDHSFRSDEIRKMELTVLKALDWRLGCVTAYSYVDLLTWHLQTQHPQTHVALTPRMAELLLRSLSDPKLIEFRPCTLAASALRCVLEELLPLDKSHVHLSDILCLLPHNQSEEMNKCFKIMEEHMAEVEFSGSPLMTPWSSPVSVMESSCDCCCDLVSTSTNRRKRKRDAMARLIFEGHGQSHLINYHRYSSTREGASEEEVLLDA